MKLLWNEMDITSITTSLIWSGSAKQAARSVVFSIAYSPDDKNFRMPNIKLGDKIVFYPGYPENEKIQFAGTITDRERKSEAGELSYTAMDKMEHFLRTYGTYKFINKTPEMIAQMLCADIGIAPGHFSKTDVAIPQIFFLDRSYYEMVMAAYTKAYQKTGKKYIAQMKGDRLEVIRKGKIIPDFVIRQGWQIIDSSYTENTDNMVNQVYIYNSDNQKIGCISNPKWVKRFGVYQDTVSVDSGNGQAEARTELHGIDKSANISMIGEYRCISGLGVIIDDARTNLKGKFWIENDTHEWKNGSYITKLELTFRNIMDIQEEDEEQAEEENGKEENVQDDSDGLNDGQKSDALEEVLNQARSWIGLGEDPPGSNHNEVTQYYGWDAAWCCMFIWAIFNKTGHGNLFMGGGKTAYCFDVMDYYKARGKFGSTPQKGALVIYGGDGHIGIVESVTGNGWVSIEGNLSNMVKRSNGPSCSTVLGFCYIDYPASANEIKDKPAVTGTAIAVPSSIPQTGIIKDYTNYSYFYSRWTAGTMQRTLANLWGNAGKPSWNGIAILDNYYLVAVRPKFGSVGDRICIVLESGARFNAIIADEKGEDAGNEWGHVYDGRISLIEFESIGNAASNDGAQLNLGPWAGKKVTTVINGGRYAGL